MKPESRSWIGGIILLTIITFVSIPLVRLAYFAITPFQKNAKDSKIIEIRRAEPPNEIARNLSSIGIISNGKEFIWLGRLTRQWKNIKVGEYQVSAAHSPSEIFSILTSGVSMVHPVTVREGENIYEVADDLTSKGLVSRSSFLALCQNPVFINSLGYFRDQDVPSLEGYIFPDTYFFNRALTDSDMVKQMVKHFFENWGQAERDRAKELKMSRHQIITLASIIEKETGAPEERPLISSVFHNRLRMGMKLQSDPTTIYGMWDRFRGKIHKSDLLESTPYNTYAVPGLPQGPIANPGKEAIHAALFPAKTEYLYFVSHNNGTHQFSRTLQEHNSAVRKYQLDPAAREGKSWRDRLKKIAPDLQSP